MIQINDLETPALLVDVDRMARNLDRGAEYARSHDILLRPHIKTHKSPALAHEQLERGAVGLTCATPYEAEVMSEVCDDLLVMYPPVGAHRAARLAQLAERVKLTVALDSDVAASDLSRAARDAGSTVRVLVEIDAGMHRVGVQSSADAVALGKRVADMPGLEVAGFAFYPGHIRGPVGEHSPQLAAARALVAETRAAFKQEGLPVDVVSAGSTPTLWRTHELSGVNEMRPGTYVFNDRTTAEIGACTLDECALTVLATVVSTAVPGQAVIDAGAKALGREPMRGGTSGGDGFGCLWSDSDVIVKSMSEEHGILDLSRSTWQPKVGDRVRVIPNHVCIVVHLADMVFGVRDDAVVSSWPVAARGRGQPVLADLGR
ncbi:MAG TPA: alanine racemase [Gemmatimonadaceae bacterium]|nr:alanine racemase [Gemmatimonadaceae bacterium]